MKVYVVFGEHSEEITKVLSSEFDVIGYDRKLDTAVATAEKMSSAPDVFIILGSALVTGITEGGLNYGKVLLENLKKLRNLCPKSRIILIVSDKVGESVISGINALGIYDYYKLDKLSVTDLPGIIRTEKDFASCSDDAKIAKTKESLILNENKVDVIAGDVEDVVKADSLLHCIKDKLIETVSNKKLSNIIGIEINKKKYQGKKGDVSRAEPGNHVKRNDVDGENVKRRGLLKRYVIAGVKKEVDRTFHESSDSGTVVEDGGNRIIPDMSEYALQDEVSETTGTKVSEKEIFDDRERTNIINPNVVKDKNYLEESKSNAVEQVEIRAITDDLTGCFLRNVLNDYTLQPNSCIIFLDLDNLKPINDNICHAAGDALLREFGKHLLNSVRPNDIVVRYGGDEFVIILENVSLQGTEAISKRILGDWRGVNYDGQFLKSGVSIGIAQKGVHGDQLKDLIDVADKAMYQGKKSGKNKMVVAGGAQLRVNEVQKDNIVGTVTICVAGAEKGIGTTHTVLAIAFFLARNSVPVAIAELPDPAPVAALPGALELMGRTFKDDISVLSKNCFRFRNIDFYFIGSETKENKYYDVFNKNYQYVILDLGYIKPREEGLHKYISEMRRSTLSVLVASAAPWKGGLLAQVMRSAKDVPELAGFKNWKIVFAAPEDNSYNQYRNALEAEKIDSFQMPYTPDPFAQDEERDAVIYHLLASVLDHSNKPRKKSWLPFKKRGT